MAPTSWGSSSTSFFLTPPRHLSLSLAPLTQTTNITPTPNNTTDALQKDWSSILQNGGVRQRWAGLCMLTCVCMCLSAAPYGVWALVCVRADIFTHAYVENMSTDSIWLLWMLVFLWFAWFSFQEFFVVMKRRSEKKQWTPAKRTPYMASLAEWTNLWRASGERLCSACDSNGCHVLKDVRFFLFV